MTDQCYIEEVISDDIFCVLKCGSKSFCTGAACMAWRWRPLMADAQFLEAVKQLTAELADPKAEIPGRKGLGETQAHKKAVALVIADRAFYGLKDTPFEGFCGLAGVPVDK